MVGTPSPKSRDWLTDDDESSAQHASVERLPCLRGPRKEQPRCVRPAPAPRVEGPGQRRYQPLRCAVTCRRYPVRDIAFLLGITPAAGEPDRAQG